MSTIRLPFARKAGFAGTSQQGMRMSADLLEPAWELLHLIGYAPEVRIGARHLAA